MTTAPWDAPWGSVLLRETLTLIMDITGNGWRRKSGGGAGRDALVSRMATDALRASSEPAQLVVVPFMGCDISPDAASAAYAIDEERSPMAPLSAWNHVHQSLSFCVWDPSVCLAGYTWEERSVWVMQLDLRPLHPRTLARQFRTIAAMMSAPGSELIVVYIEQPIVEIAVGCGFVVVLDSPFDEVAVEMGFAKTEVRGLRIAKFSHAWKRVPTRRELHLASLPHPLEDLDDFLESSGSDFTLSSPALTPIEDIQPDVDPAEEAKMRAKRLLEKEKKAKELQKMKKDDEHADEELRVMTKAALESLEKFLATEPFSQLPKAVERVVPASVEIEQSARDGGNQDSSGLASESFSQAGNQNEEHAGTPSTLFGDVVDAAPANLPAGVSEGTVTIAEGGAKSSIHLDSEHDVNPSGETETRTDADILIDTIAQRDAESSIHLDSDHDVVPSGETWVCTGAEILVDTSAKRDTESPIHLESEHAVLVSDESETCVKAEAVTDINEKQDTESSVRLDSEHVVLASGETGRSTEAETIQCDSKAEPCRVPEQIEEKVETQSTPVPSDVSQLFRFSLFASEIPQDDDVMLMVVGNDKAIGEWGVAGALPMHGDGDLHVAHADISTMSTGDQDLEYKYALVRVASGARTIIAWEEAGNRVLHGGPLGNRGTGTDHVHAWSWI